MSSDKFVPVPFQQAELICFQDHVKGLSIAVCMIIQAKEEGTDTETLRKQTPHL